MINFIVKKDTLSDMVDNMVDDVAIVHQIPFTCDRIDNNTESMISPSTEDVTDPTIFLQHNGKIQHQSRPHNQQRRFIATLEKVSFFFTKNYLSNSILKIIFLIIITNCNSKLKNILIQNMLKKLQ